jgi:hypothetical protein
MWNTVQFWDHLRWSCCLIWNVSTIHNNVYSLNKPLPKLVSTSEDLNVRFCQFQTEFHANMLLFKILKFQLAKIAKEQETGIVYCRYLMTNWCGVTGQVRGKSLRSPLDSATVRSHLCWLVGILFNMFGFFLDWSCKRRSDNCTYWMPLTAITSGHSLIENNNQWNRNVTV